jgi:hypothetical protein
VEGGILTRPLTEDKMKLGLFGRIEGNSYGLKISI